MAELHVKAGDLYFFKGRNHLTAVRFGELSAAVGSRENGGEGYLLCAHFHYAMGLHDLRRFICFRKNASSERWNAWEPGSTRGQRDTIEPKGWSDFMFRAVGGALGDLSESRLARVSFFGVMGCLRTIDAAKVATRFSICKWCAESFNCLGCPGEGQTPDWLHRSLVMPLYDIVCMWLESDGTSFDQQDSWASFAAQLHTAIDVGPGSLQHWFGCLSPKAYWAERVWGSDGNWLHFGSDDDNDLQRLVMALLMDFVAAEMLDQGGYPEDAARELLQITETVNHWLSWATGADTFAKMATDGSSENGWRKVLKECGFTTNVGCRFWCFLLDLGLSALERAWALFQKSHNTPRLGESVPVGMLHASCALGISVLSKRWTQGGRGVRIHALIKKMVEAGTFGPNAINVEGHDQVQWHASLATNLVRIVQQGVERYRYPGLARLRGLRLLVDIASILHPKAEPAWREDVVRLEFLDGQMQSPLHFTPMHMGITLGQLALRGDCLTPKMTLDEQHRIARDALRHLDASLEMTSMRRAYYEAISGLYYLYDDFNDSQIHYNHAIQMAGYEYVCLIRELLERMLNPAAP